MASNTENGPQLPTDTVDMPSSSEEEKDEEKKRSNVRIQNVGGSLSFLLQIALLAFVVRQLRSVLAKRRDNQQRASQGAGSSAPACPPISPAAMRLLVELEPTPYNIIDVRYRNAVKASPPPFQGTVNIPDGELRGALQLPSPAWDHRFGSTLKPDRRQLLVFISTRGRRAHHAAAAAASLGYSRCCVLAGGLQAYATSSSQGLPPKPAFISRHGVALLLEMAHVRPSEGEGESLTPPLLSSSRSPKVMLVDLRRHEERTLYGAIPGSLHVPVDLWPRALAMDADAWDRNIGCPQVSPEYLVILYCRSNRRARWAAQLAADSGFKRCYVCQEGTFGWRFDATVLPYNEFKEGEVPPAPIPFEVEKADLIEGADELRLLGLQSL